MANLAIKGHETRGKEVIEILEMLGGKKSISWDCSSQGLFYFVDVKGDINAISDTNKYLCNYTLYTLEKFIEEFPYKVGDKAITFGNVCKIIDTEWDEAIDEVAYGIKLCESGYITTKLSSQLQPYKEQETMEEQIMTEDITLEKAVMCTFREMVEGKQRLRIAMNKGFELKEENGNFFVYRKKVEYPKTYEECCDVLKIEYPYFKTEKDGISASTYKNELFGNLKQLLICRDAYWKLAEWNPKIKGERFYMNSLPSFLKDLFPMPSEEMRYAFYENFKSLIEECKELL